MSQTEYSINCFNNYHDITYGTECNTYEEAVNKVDYYRELIRTNGEEDMHSVIEISRDTIDDEGEIISSKLLKTYSI